MIIAITKNVQREPKHNQSRINKCVHSTALCLFSEPAGVGGKERGGGGGGVLSSDSQRDRTEAASVKV